MRLTKLQVKNWRNFHEIDFRLGQRLIIVGANATGKSNLLDVFRFLRDIASPQGGLSSAIENRGGLSTIRNLNARNFNNGHVEILVVMDDGGEEWTYNLAISRESSGLRRPTVAKEVVTRAGETILSRPNAADNADPVLLTQTHLEQIASNTKFRDVARFFEGIRYSHPSPQSIRHSSPTRTSSDAVGNGLIAEINATQERTRLACLKRIQAALQTAVPNFESLKLEIDKAGHPHLVAAFKNWRKNPANQLETEFSDGTLRLIALLWAVLSQPRSEGILLLEEPEISLNREIIQQLPSMIASVQRGKDMQVVMTSHSPDLLDDEGVASEEILVLTRGDENTQASLLSECSPESDFVDTGVLKSEAISNLINPRIGTGLVQAMQ